MKITAIAAAIGLTFAAPSLARAEIIVQPKTVMIGEAKDVAKKPPAVRQFQYRATSPGKFKWTARLSGG